MLLFCLFSSLLVLVVNGATEEEKQKAIEELRTKVGDVPHPFMKEDFYLVRWLIATEWNMADALELFKDASKQNIKWREINKMDGIMKEDWAEFKEKFPHYMDTVSKAGQPIRTGNVGEWDIRAVAVSGKLNAIMRYMELGMEESLQGILKIRMEGKNVTRFDFIFNMDGYNEVQHGCTQCMAFYVALINSYERHYPGFCDRIILFNSPPSFEVVLSVIKPLMSADTRNALEVYGHDKTQWQKRLLEVVDASQLTPDYGGTFQRKQ
ncbi:SEC14-like protein 2 [Orchesella cincta]|uniref:SEC14-like protein 2 n=1 Tax=Orchesella cincta TaxID=48709 RepID=A0A1D2N2I6_ORCCI|nr:SEC14-like protein 2 [Orchesella cincta]